MNRRRIAALSVPALLFLAGCGTDPDVVAQVGDAELTVDELESRAEGLGMVGDDGRIPGDDARIVIANWIGLQAAENTGIIDSYEQGPFESGIVCVYGLAAPDAATGDEWVERLDNGETWRAIAEEATPDTDETDETGETGDEQPEIDPVVASRTRCTTIDTIGPVADQLVGVTLDAPHALITFPDQTLAVIRVQSVDELNGFELLQAVQQMDAALVDEAAASLDDVEIEVDARYGVYDPETINVVPAG